MVMNITTIIITLLVILLVGYAAFFAYDLFKHKDEFEKETNFWITGVIGAIVNFFDPLGRMQWKPTVNLYCL